MGKFEGFYGSDNRKKAGEKPVDRSGNRKKAGTELVHESGEDFAAKKYHKGPMLKDVRGDNQDANLKNRANKEMLQQRADGMTRQQCIDKQKEILKKCMENFWDLKLKMLEEYRRIYLEKYLNIRKKYADLLDSNYQAATKRPSLFESCSEEARRDQEARKDQAEIGMRMLAYELTDLVDTTKENMQKSMKELKELKEIELGGATAGENNPNQDTYYIDPESSSVAIFDGAGGHEGGAIASAIARDYIRKEFRKPGTFLDGMSPKEVGEIMRQKLIDANMLLYKINPEMRTTATVVKMIKFEGKVFAVIAYIGDSPVRYLPQGSDTLEHLTNDAGEAEPGYLKIQKEMANLETFKDPPPHLKPYVKERHGLYGVLGGSEQCQPSVHIQEIKRGDAIVMMSDGISENLTDKRIAATLKANLSDPEKVTNALMEAVDEKCKRFKDRLKEAKQKALERLSAIYKIRWRNLDPEVEYELYSEISDELRAKPDDKTVIVLKCGEKITSSYLDR